MDLHPDKADTFALGAGQQVSMQGSRMAFRHFFHSLMVPKSTGCRLGWLLQAACKHVKK